MKQFPNFIQLYKKDCGPTCLKIISKYYGKNIPSQFLENLCDTSKIGTNLKYLQEASETIGFNSLGVMVTLEELKTAPLPCILFWENEHFVVLYKVKGKKYYISDPAIGLITVEEEEFLEKWITNKEEGLLKGVALLLEITNNFYKQDYKAEKPKINVSFITKYLGRQRKLIFQLFIGLVIGLVIQVSLPFITQNIIDYGILNKDLKFIYLLLFAQVFLVISNIIVEIVRGWILHFIGNRVKIYFISEFLINLLKLPIKFFDNKDIGDLMQRLNDHDRIRKLLTYTTLNSIFSIFTIIVFSVILAFYSLKLFVIFTIGTILYFVWFILFLKKRAIIDNNTFKLQAKDRSNILGILDGMQDIKLNNAEVKSRKIWEDLQIKIFENESRSLKNQQFQNDGTEIINELKNVFLVFTSAILVVNGQISIGMMLAIMYIIAQLNNPLVQILVFIQDLQYAYLSYQRLNQINDLEKEEKISSTNLEYNLSKDIIFESVSFKYSGSENNTIDNISFTIPYKKTTAIVGRSGSGKTTLVKLLLNFYQPTKGVIKIDDTELESISLNNWRDYCGVVLQDGKIINDTLLENICLSDSSYDMRRFKLATLTANIDEFIHNLPLKENTIIGSDGLNLSGGQKQRILIARAIYKNPGMLIFDEATSSLDTENEKIIVENLERLSAAHTSVVIAHRLSTVKKADNIIVLDNGKIIEQGSHNELIHNKGHYYNLVKNQLDLESI